MASGMSGRFSSLLAAVLVASTFAVGLVGGEESATKLGIASFAVEKAELLGEGDLLRVTMSYDASICGNPWQGGIYGYGEIEALQECHARAHFYEEDDLARASALASTAATWTGFSVIGTRIIYENAPEGTTYMVSWKSAAHRFDDSSPLSGSVDLEIELPSSMKYLRERKTYHIVVVGDITYKAFNGAWSNVAGLGPITVQVGEDVDELSLRVDGPDEFEAGGQGATFNLTATGKDATKEKVDRVAWTLSYYAQGAWTDLDPMDAGDLSDLRIADADLRALWSLAVNHGTRYTQHYLLNMRVSARAYSGDDLLATSNTHSFRVVAVEELRLSVDGPETIDAQIDEVTFELKVEGEEETKGKVDGVVWVFSYKIPGGDWVDAFWTLEESIGNLVMTRGDGGIIDHWYDLVMVSGEPVAGSKRLQMRVTAEARSGSRTIGASEPRSFWVVAPGLDLDTNLTGRYDVYPTWPTTSTVEILYDGKQPIRLDVEGTIPAYVNVTFDPQIIEPEEGEEGIYYTNMSIAFDATRAPGISLPRQEEIKLTIEGMDLKYEKSVTLTLLKAKWLVMIYMAMDTMPDLLPAAMDYMVTLTKVFQAKGSPEVGVVVLLDSTPGNSAQLFTYERSKRVSRKIASWGPTNMSDSKTLKRFVTEATRAIPAERNLLMIDAHGAGIRGIVYDQNQGESKHPMKFQPMLEALKGTPIEIIAFNSCLMGQTEVLHHLSSLAPYLVASELIMPGTGLDLDGLFSALFGKPDMSGEEVAKLLVSEYRTRHDRYFQRNITLSCLRADKLAAVASAIDAFAKQLLKGYEAKDGSFNRTIADIGLKTEMVNGGYPYADIKDFAQRVAADPRVDQALKSSAARVVGALDDATVSEEENVWILKDLTFVKTSNNGYNGLSIFLWNYRTEGDEGKVYRDFIKHYDQTTFSRVTAWGSFLREYSRSVPRTARAVHLTHLLHELHLHVYDGDGNHVGYNSSSTDRTPIDCGIPGAIYSDMGNGTKIILLPESVNEFTVVVDGRDMEEPEEPYELRVTLVVDDEVADIQEMDMTIRENTSHRTEVEVSGRNLALGETIVEGDAASRLPGWFRRSMLLPLVRPILPLIPDPLLPAFPYLLVGLPVVVLIAAGVVVTRSRGRRSREGPPGESTERSP